MFSEDCRHRSPRAVEFHPYSMFTPQRDQEKQKEDQCHLELGVGTGGSGSDPSRAQGFFVRLWKFSKIVVIVLPLCEYTKNHWTVHFQWVNCMACELYLQKYLFQQHKRRLYTWTSPDGQYQNQIDYILCSQRWRSSIESAKTRPGADCGSGHELRSWTYCQIQTSTEESRENHQTIQVWPRSNPLWLYSGSEK